MFLISDCKIVTNKMYNGYCSDILHSKIVVNCVLALYRSYANYVIHTIPYEYSTNSLLVMLVWKLPSPISRVKYLQYWEPSKDETVNCSVLAVLQFRPGCKQNNSWSWSTVWVDTDCDHDQHFIKV